MINRRRISAAAVVILAVAVVGGGASRYRQHLGESPPPADAGAPHEHANGSHAHETTGDGHTGTKSVTLRFFKSPETLAPLTMETIDGRTITAADLRGRVTLVNFWATWCPPCRAEIPDLIALQEKYRGELRIVGISEDVGAVDTVKQFVADHGVTYPVVIATPEIEAVFAGVSALPTSFVLDRDLRVVQRHLGLLDPTITEHEVRALAGLPVDATVEYVDPAQPLGLENAAQAKEIPGVDLARLSPAQRAEALQALNAEPCPCGCGFTVARCRIEDPSCPVSLPLARQIVDGIAAVP